MKRARSSYTNLRMRHTLNESINNRDQSFSNSKNLDIEQLESYYYPDQLKNGVFYNNNKDYGISPNDYGAKFKNQVKRKKMFEELWNKDKASKINFGLLNAIKIQNRLNKNSKKINRTGEMRGLVRKKRIASAGTFCNIPIKSKKPVVLFKNFNSTFNINSLTKIRSCNCRQASIR